MKFIDELIDNYNKKQAEFNYDWCDSCNEWVASFAAPKGPTCEVCDSLINVPPEEP